MSLPRPYPADSYLGETGEASAWLRRTDAHLNVLRGDRLWLLNGEATTDQGEGPCRPER